MDVAQIVGLSKAQGFQMVLLLMGWAQLLFGGMLAGTPTADNSRRMPAWTRMSSSIALVLAAWSWWGFTNDTILQPMAFWMAVGMTFGFIGEEKPHCVAAALAFGREKLIPAMFRQFLEGIQIGQAEAPSFHYYLERHITLDEDFHGPLSMKLLEKLCGGDPGRVAEAESAAQEALHARLRFWDGVLEAMRS